MVKIAIGITTHNNIANLEKIKEVYNNKNFDTFIVDDMSDDGLVEELIKQNIKFVSTSKNVGAPGKSRNMILDMVIDKYDYITFMDGDDYFILDNLLLVANKINPDVEFICTSLLSKTCNYTTIPINAKVEYNKVINVKEINDVEFYKVATISSGGRIYKLSTIKQFKLRYADDLPGQDTLFNKNFITHIKKIQYINDAIFYVRIIDDNTLSNKININSLIKRCKSIYLMYEYNNSVENLDKINYKILKILNETGMGISDKKKILDVLSNDINEIQIKKNLNKGINFYKEQPKRIEYKNLKIETMLGLTILNLENKEVEKIFKKANFKYQIINIIRDDKIAENMNKELNNIKYDKIMIINNNISVSKEFDINKYYNLILEHPNDLLVPQVWNSTNMLPSLKTPFYYDMYTLDNLHTQYMLIIDTKIVLECGFVEEFSEQMLMFELVYQTLKHKNLKLIPYNGIIDNNNRTKEPLILGLDSRNILMCSKAVQKLNKEIISETSIFQYHGDKIKLNQIGNYKFCKNELDFINYQINFLCITEFDGVVLRNINGEIAVILEFKKTNNVDKNKFKEIGPKLNTTNKLEDTKYLNVLKNNNIAVLVTTNNCIKNIKTLENLYFNNKVEVYFVDECSHDGTREKLRELNIPFLINKNSSIISSKKLLLQEIKNKEIDYFIFLNGKDSIFLSNLFWATNNLEPKIEIVITNIYYQNNSLFLTKNKENYTFKKYKINNFYATKNGIENLFHLQGNIYKYTDNIKAISKNNKYLNSKEMNKLITSFKYVETKFERCIYLMRELENNYTFLPIEEKIKYFNFNYASIKVNREVLFEEYGKNLVLDIQKATNLSVTKKNELFKKLSFIEDYKKTNKLSIDYYPSNKRRSNLKLKKILDEGITIISIENNILEELVSGIENYQIINLTYDKQIVTKINTILKDVKYNKIMFVDNNTSFTTKFKLKDYLNESKEGQLTIPQVQTPFGLFPNIEAYICKESYISGNFHTFFGIIFESEHVLEYGFQDDINLSEVVLEFLLTIQKYEKLQLCLIPSNGINVKRTIKNNNKYSSQYKDIFGEKEWCFALEINKLLRKIIHNLDKIRITNLPPIEFSSVMRYKYNEKIKMLILYQIKSIEYNKFHGVYLMNEYGQIVDIIQFKYYQEIIQDKYLKVGPIVNYEILSRELLEEVGYKLSNKKINE